jgi:hypothetical protein
VLLVIFFKEKAGEEDKVEGEPINENEEPLIPEPEVEVKEFSLK